MHRSRTDWWTWSDDPDTTDDDKQLAFDPACGKMTRPIVSDMLALAASRRCGQHPEYTSAWGEEIGKLPGLKTFELVLETFSAKKRQLDTVVDCARTWKFPLQGTRSELVHDGRVEAVKSTKPADEDGSSCSTRGNGNGLREQECSGLYIEQSKSRGVREEVFHNGAGVFQDDPGLEGDGYDNWNDVQNRPWDDDETFGPTSHWDEEDQSDFSPISPIYDRDGTQDDWDAFPNEPWMHDAHGFEVRVVRFRRRRAS